MKMRPVNRDLICRSLSLLALLLLSNLTVTAQGVDQAKEKPIPFQAASTIKMSEQLEKIGKSLEAVRIPYTGLADPGLLQYFWQIKQPLDFRGELIVEVRNAYDLLLRGRSKEAARRFEQVKSSVIANNKLFDRSFLKSIRELLAVSYLRIGLQEDTSTPYTAAAPRLQIQNEDPDEAPAAMRAAIKEYLEILQEDDHDLTSRWLLNLAYTGLGEYPDNVPKRFLLPPNVFRSDYNIKQFRDVAPDLDLDTKALAGGSLMEDLDGDSYLDIMTSSIGFDKERDQLHFFHNNGDGAFSDRTEAAGLRGITGGLNISSADYNNDGCIDLVIPRGAWLGTIGHHPPSLLRNNCDGTFTDVTVEAGLMTMHPSQTAVWADFDNDGLVDLFVGNESMPTYRALSINIKLASARQIDRPIYFFDYQDFNPCQLFHNNGDGTFTDVADKVGLGVLGWVKGATAGDYDNDGFIDLYISRLGEPNLLMRNSGPNASGGWKFTDMTESARVAAPIQSYSCWFWDYDNDGWLDIFVSGYSIDDFAHQAGQVAADYLGLPFTAETPRLYRNNHDGTFDDVTSEVGLHHPLFSMGGNHGDLDNDGYEDLYLGTGGIDYRSLIPNRMFRNKGGKYFQDVTSSAGVGFFQKGQAVSFGDIDNDGNQDIYAVLGGVYPGDTSRRALFLNPGHRNHWIEIKLEGVQSNRAGIGARIKTTVALRKGSRDIYSTISGGSSFGSTSLRLVVGLGMATSIRALEVRWPVTGKAQVFRRVKLDQNYVIHEGSRELKLVKLTRLRLKRQM
jgi:hypothetical protein